MSVSAAPLSPSPPAPMAAVSTPASPHSSHPMSPAPLNISSSIDDTIARQVEWYLSRHNLPTDRFLKQHMDTDYWVPLELILTFPRMKALGAKDSARVASLLHARAPDIEVDAQAGRIRPAWALRSNLILREVPTSVTYADIATLLRIPYTPNGVVPPRPDPDTQHPHFAGLVCVLQVAESTWLVIFDNPTGAKDAFPAIDGTKIQGQKISAQVYCEGLEPQSTPYVPTVYQAMPNTYTPAAPPHLSTHSSDGVAYSTDAGMYPYAYVQYPTVPNNVDSQPAIYMHPHQLSNDSSSAPSPSPRRSSPSSRANNNGGASSHHRMNGQRVNGHRRTHHTNGRPQGNPNGGNSSNGHNQSVMEASRSPTHGQGSKRRLRNSKRTGGTPRHSSPGTSNGHHHNSNNNSNHPTSASVVNAVASAVAGGKLNGTNNGVSTDGNGSGSNSGTSAPLSAETTPRITAEPAPDVSAMHFPPLSTPPAMSSDAGPPMSTDSGSTWGRDVLSVINSSPKPVASNPPTENHAPSPVPKPVPNAVVSPKTIVKEPNKESNTGSTSTTPISYAAILRSKPSSAPVVVGKSVAAASAVKAGSMTAATCSAAVVARKSSR